MLSKTRKSLWTGCVKVKKTKSRKPKSRKSRKVKSKKSRK